MSYLILPPFPNIAGVLAGSSQPGNGSAISMAQELETLARLKCSSKLYDREELLRCGVDIKLLQDLQKLYGAGFRRIYGLLEKDPKEGERNSELIKMVWEGYFQNTAYIREIKGIATAITDFYPPTLKQLQVISDDMISHIKKGDNVVVHCRGGLGRTGTILAAVDIALNPAQSYNEAIKYIRKEYSKHAVETEAQELILQKFQESLNRGRAVINPSNGRS